MKECPKCKHCYNDDILVCPADQAVPAPTIVGSTTISGRYILESRLGQGGMGIVFRAKHKFLKSSHAIKIILPSLVDGDADLLVRFNQEAVLAASIDHPNVIRVTDFGVENDVMPFLVMEYIDGLPLSSYLIEDKPLELKEAFELFFPGAEGVAEAHSKGIVHRDLKPQNIIVQKNLPFSKAVKVLDFGLAKIKSADSYPSLIQAKTMNIVGSPPYMSPEQWSGEGVDHRTDIYALAVILYQMLTGRLPFNADSMPAMMYQHLTVAPPKAETFGITLMPGLEDIVQKALEKDPANRYDSMNKMLSDLTEVVGAQDIQRLTGAATEYMIPRSSLPQSLPTITDESQPLTDSQKKRFYSYFDEKEKPSTIGDPKLAQEFLDAQDKIEFAKTEAINADQLVQDLVEAQKEAEVAQQRATDAKERIEADVRRKVEAEMERLAVEDHAKREAEAKRLAEEVEARRIAEERANYLAQAALEAQQLAETERKKREEEAQQRELHQSVRRDAEVEARHLAEQVAESRRQYEDAKKEAEREAKFRAEAEIKQKKIESEIEILTYNEAERRKMVEANAQKYIEEQAGRFEAEAQAAKQRLDEAKLLADTEAEKREQAEAARIQAEKEAERLSQQIVEVQRQMDEMRQHITFDTQGRSSSSIPGLPGQSFSDTGSKLSPLTQRSGQLSSEIPPELLNTGKMAAKKPVFAALVIGIIAIFVFAGGSVGLYLFLRAPVVVPVANQNTTPPADQTTLTARKSVAINGGTFKMGSNDVEDKAGGIWANQYPEHPKKVESFNIDAYETTNVQYADFIKETKHPKPPDWEKDTYPTNEANFPVTNVTLADAKAYAVWVSQKEKKTCRLPTENEWEYAARNGTKSTLFPWGNDWKPDFAKLKGRVVAVGTTKDVTLDGVFDMLGNVSEWTSTPFDLYPGSLATFDTKGRYAIRGLYYQTKDVTLEKPNLLVTFRQAPKETEFFPFLGFRLVCQP